MGIVFLDDTYLKNIADKIREKYKAPLKYKVANMPNGIEKVYECGVNKGYEDGYAEGKGDGGYWKQCWANMKTGGGTYVVPEGMTEIPDYMFRDFKNFSSISIPDSVTKIGEYAFKDNKTLASATLPDSITEIGQFAFHLCENVEFDKFPQNITVLNSAVFGACRKAKFRHLNNKLKYIIAYAFDGCWENNTAVIPASVEHIGNAAFGSNRGMKELTILGKPDMSATALSGCTNLTDIYCIGERGDYPNAPWGSSATVRYNYFKNAAGNFTIPSGMNEIPEKMFQNNTKIYEILMGNEVTAIRPYAFNGCTNLEYVTFPDGLVIIEEYAFLGCPKLNITSLPDTVDEIEVAALAGTKCALSKLPFNLRKIEDDAFDLCKGNTFTEIPFGVFTIGARAFKENTGLTELTIHYNSDLHIHPTAFVGCDNLFDIYVDWAEGEVAGEFDANGNRINWGAPNAAVHHMA